jgi:hypothetical protein
MAEITAYFIINMIKPSQFINKHLKLYVHYFIVEQKVLGSLRVLVSAIFFFVFYIE